MPDITLCMIVKNESAILERCLNSYKDIFDEIVIVDTGSTDSTLDIARRFTDKIYNYIWKNDFADARNFAFSKATCEYIFTADADEVLDDVNKARFLRLKSSLLPEVDIVQMKYINNVKDGSNTVYNCKKEYRPKLYRRLRAFRWISPIHETVRLEPIIYNSDIEILHCPTSSHTKRDLDIFINAVNKGIHLENYVLIMFCKELFISGKDEDFIGVKDIFQNKLSSEYDNVDCQKNINCVLARAYRLTNDYNNFFKICLKDMAVDPCAEICMELGQYYYNLGDYKEAVLWFINASSETPSIINIHSSGDFPLRALSMCYDKLSACALIDGNAELAATYAANMREYNASALAWELPDEL